jgi:osmotically-inducible protein OsmY
MSIRSILAFVFLTVVAGFGYAGTAAKPPAATKKAAAPQAAAHPAQTDAQLEKAIRERFAESKIAEDKFEVHVQGGKATITGSTNVLQHKGTATRLARSMGAAEVINKVEPTEEAREKAAANLTKGRRRAQIKRGDERSRQR